MLLFAPAICFSGGQDEKKEKSTFPIPIEITFNMRGTYGFHDVRGFPLSIRSVPRHEDDDWIGATPYLDEPLPDTVLSLRRSWANDISVLYAPKIFGIGVMFSFHRHSDREKGTRYRQNQYGTAKRGTGMSLRWYQLGLNNSVQIGLVGYVATPWIRITKQDFSFRLKTGGVWDMTGARLDCHSGWDRWSADQHWKNIGLVKFYENRVFAGLEIGLTINENKAHRRYFYIQVMYFQSFYDLKRRGAAPNLTWEPAGGDNYLSIGLGIKL